MVSLRKRVRRIKRYVSRKQPVIIGCAAVLFVASISYAVYMNQRRLVADPASYGPLLQVIAQAESKDNYNAYFGNAGNTSLSLTTMSIAQVLQWQQRYLQQGSPSDAVGRYQIISPTLIGLVDQLGIDRKALFDQAMQDRLGRALLQRRGGDRYVNNELTNRQFAANLTQEWAALPRVIGDDPETSYYAGDGLNRSLVDVDTVLRAIEAIRSK